MIIIIVMKNGSIVYLDQIHATQVDDISSLHIHLYPIELWVVFIYLKNLSTNDKTLRHI